MFQRAPMSRLRSTDNNNTITQQNIIVDDVQSLEQQKDTPSTSTSFCHQQYKHRRRRRRYIQGGQTAYNTTSSWSFGGQLSSMFISTDCFTVTYKCGCSTEYHDVNHSDCCCATTDVSTKRQQGKKRRFHQYKTAHIMNTIIFILVHIITIASIDFVTHHVDALSLPSSLSHLRYHSGVYLGNKNMMQTSSILLMTDQSTKSDNAASKSDNTASTSTSDTNIINPAATPSSSSLQWCSGSPSLF